MNSPEIEKNNDDKLKNVNSSKTDEHVDIESIVDKNDLSKEYEKTVVEITVVGPDKKGVVAEITNFIFKNGGNIEKINQNVIHGLFGMQLEASFQKLDKEKIDSELKKLSSKLEMEVKTHYQESNRLKNIAILVSKEDHCLNTILEANENDDIFTNVKVIIGSTNELENIAEKYCIPFYNIKHNDQATAEKEILDILERYNVDIIILARYMRILTPNFVWRYPNKIINIHPSILPAFPGAYAYVQAYERGAKIVGCTAHFVTEDLDQGPIICQNSFKVSEKDTIESIKQKGQALEAITLLEALKMVFSDKLEIYWGKVHVKDQ